MNTAADTQILAAYEQGMTPANIADDLGFDIKHVKARLMQLSTPYRKACGAEKEDVDELNFTREEALAIKREIFQLAMSTEDEYLKGKLLIQLRDDSKGRKDVVKQMQGTQFNILQLVNNSLSQARESASKLKDSIINVKEIAS